MKMAIQTSYPASYPTSYEIMMAEQARGNARAAGAAGEAAGLRDAGAAGAGDSCSCPEWYREHAREVRGKCTGAVYGRNPETQGVMMACVDGCPKYCRGRRG